MTTLVEAAARCLQETDPETKCRLTTALHDQWKAGAIAPDEAMAAFEIDESGRPERPALVHPRDLPKRSLGTDEGKAALRAELRGTWGIDVA